MGNGKRINKFCGGQFCTASPLKNEKKIVGVGTGLEFCPIEGLCFNGTVFRVLLQTIHYFVSIMYPCLKGLV
jgi:hypothetical protein